ncbi:hypothetical protein [Nocardioides mangrovi]|uniref:Integral membrane protein n=1 Tax=Nocardioides mangrovi TaxID=2874580 RepID=A0ABS7UI03_9ACTN|nr:hypothetical protein [Nocardioides mangrovi]MBZ5740301.1 hypothetical protein [Nocardioides mangrovi]
MADETGPASLSDDRVRVLNRLLYAALGLAGLLVLVGLLFVWGDDDRGGTITTVCGLVIALLGLATLRALRARSESARRLVITTAVLLIVLSIFLVAILVGLLTVIVGVGLLVVLLAPEREDA